MRKSEDPANLKEKESMKFLTNSTMLEIDSDAKLNHQYPQKFLHKNQQLQ